MYQPKPPRRKKTTITRSRNGCMSCRLRRKKCDEKRPSCSECVRLGKACEAFSRGHTFRLVSFPVASSSQICSPSASRRVPDHPVIRLTRSEYLTSAAQAEGPENVYLQCGDTTILEEGLHQISIAEHQACDQRYADSAETWTAHINAQDLRVTYDRLVSDHELRTCNDGLTNNTSHERLDRLAGHSYSLPVTDDFASYSSGTKIGWSGLLPISDSYTSLHATKGSRDSIFYIEKWEELCRPALHPALGRLGMQGHLPAVIRDALLALSACQLSRSIPRRKSFDLGCTSGLSFRPDPQYQITSLNLYGSAVISLARWDVSVGARRDEVALAAMVLLAHFETRMGDFRQFGTHSMGVDHLLRSLEVGGGTPSLWTCGLIQNWVQAKAHNWWLRYHFSTPDFHLSSKPLIDSVWLTAILEASTDTRAAIMTALCECCRLRSVAVLHHWSKVAHGRGNNLCTNDDIEKPLSGPARPHTTWSALSEFTTQWDILDRWHDRLMLSELPVEGSLIGPGSASTTRDGQLVVHPLRFTSHQAAMNYAYYVVSRLLLGQIAALDRDSCLAENFTPSDHEADFWALLLARIAAGLDWNACTRLNTFTIGLSTLFLTCALSRADPGLRLWMQNWLEQRYSPTALEEGSFPVLQTLQVLRAIDGERSQGRVAYLVCASIEDGGGAAKYSSYNSQTVTSFLMFGYDTAREAKCVRTVAL
ncbi:hypothetical protein SVAN01_11548 [Stagonosporopsis vannaccii]|nr:hypothetical protein SVAN01_11548 [Stagonosporopsis vannaccii]